jgi:CheY-like chemotaxis protein
VNLPDPFDLDFTHLSGKEALFVSARPRPGHPRNNVVLVLDEDGLEAESIAGLLRTGGYSAVVQTGAAEALRHMMGLGAPALIFLAPEFAGGGGFEFLKRLRAHPQLRDSAVIVFASRPDRGDFRRAIEAGADGYVVKTFDAGVLLAAVRTVLG